jgi:hypothetical protein
VSFALSGDTVFFFSDPAGARACLAAAFLLRQRRPAARVRLFSNRIRSFGGDAPPDLAVEHVDAVHAACFEGASIVFTGTSHPDSSGSFELQAIDAAERLGLPTAAFVDHWVNFRLRFESDRGLILPRTILVIDEEARRRAIAEGLPEDRLQIWPNPHLVYLARHWRPRGGRAATRRLLSLGDEQTFVILYAPDPIRMRDPGGRRGFDEIGATHDLLACLGGLGDRVQVLVKLHPLQPAEPIRTLLASSPQVIVAAAGQTDVGQTDVPELIHASDAVVGFFSNLLLEADALKRPVVRYYPGDRASDPLAHLALGTRVGSVGELANELRRLRAEALKTRS